MVERKSYDSQFRFLPGNGGGYCWKHVDLLHCLLWKAIIKRQVELWTKEVTTTDIGCQDPCILKIPLKSLFQRVCKLSCKGTIAYGYNMSQSDFTALLLFIKHYHELLGREGLSTVVNCTNFSLRKDDSAIREGRVGPGTLPFTGKLERVIQKIWIMFALALWRRILLIDIKA